LDRFRRLLWRLVLSSVLGLVSPIAVEAMPGVESIEEDTHHHWAARVRARPVRSQHPRGPEQTDRDALLRRPNGRQRPDRPVVDVRPRKIPSLIPDSPTALPDH
jgi:hypothetical protein